MSCCRVYTLLETDSPCLLNLQDGNQVVSINLHGATVRPIDGGFLIQGLNAGAKVAPDSLFTQADIEARIAACHANSLVPSGGSPACTERVVLEGVGTWELPANVYSFSYYVVAVGSEGSPPTFTDGTGATDLYESEGAAFNSPNGNFLEANVEIETFADDLIVVTMLRECA